MGQPADPVALRAGRLLIAFATRRPRALEFAPELARGADPDQVWATMCDAAHVRPADRSLLLDLARAYCLTHGEATLSLGRWRELLLLESERFRRSPGGVRRRRLTELAVHMC